MSSHLDNQSRLLDHEGSSAHSRTALCLRRLRIVVEIVSQELTHVRRPLALPSDSEHFASGRNIFPDHSSSRRLNLLHAIGDGSSVSQRPLHMELIRLHRSNITAQRCHRSVGSRDDREQCAQGQQWAAFSSNSPLSSEISFRHFSDAGFAVRLGPHRAGLPARAQKA
jgi:hypothetical protein